MNVLRSATVESRADRRDPSKDVIVRLVEDESGPGVLWLALVRPTANSVVFMWTDEQAHASAFAPETAAFVAANLDAVPV